MKESYVKDLITVFIYFYKANASKYTKYSVAFDIPDTCYFNLIQFFKLIGSKMLSKV